MPATAVALNLDKAPVTEQEPGAADRLVGSIVVGGDTEGVINGMLQRHALSTGLAAYPADADGVPFNTSHTYASGNLAADMYCNVAAGSTGMVLACRPYEAINDAGMKERLAFNVARDTMHQRQWLSVIEELGPQAHLPMPNIWGQSKETQK